MPDNYLKQLETLRAAGRIPTAPGAATYVTVAHDNWCQKLKGGVCGCQPDIELFDARTGKPLVAQ